MNSKNNHPETLLPWYVNGSLSDIERDEVESHIQNCDYCQGEISLLNIMRSEIKKTEASPGELSKLRFMREIKREKTASTTMTTSWWKQGLAVAAALVIMVQTGIIYTSAPGSNGANQNIEVAEKDKPIAVKLASGDTAEIKVRFQPTATIKQINRVLGSINATVIGGPESGLYEINVSGVNQKLSSKKIRDIVSKLQQEKTVVEYAQGNAE